MNKKQRLYLKITANDPEFDSHSCSECWENCLSHSDKKGCLDSMFKCFKVDAWKLPTVCKQMPWLRSAGCKAEQESNI